MQAENIFWGVLLIIQRKVVCSEKIKQFIQENQSFLEHKVVKSFLEKEENKNLLIEALCFPTLKNKQKLDDEFKKYYFNTTINR